MSPLFPDPNLFPDPGVFPGSTEFPGSAPPSVVPAGTPAGVGLAVGASLAQTPHLAWPVARGRNGKLVTVEQDTVNHVRACENVILRCNLGFRIDRPEFGWKVPMWQNAPADVSGVMAALALWEPRPRAMKVTEYGDLADASQRHFYTEIRVEAGDSA